MQMIRSRSIALLGVALLIGSILFPASIGSSVLAATPADRSDVVLILDFSASILDDKANRDRFAAALDRIAVASSRRPRTSSPVTRRYRWSSPPPRLPTTRAAST